MFLDQIAQAKREEIAAARLRRPLGELQAAIEDAPQPRPWGSVLRVPGRVQLIAELKKASPSRGVLRADFDPLAIAQTYAQGGAAALSVLTDSTFFQGGLDLLPELRKVVDLPLLRKDFILDPYQIYESRVWGADAILLIVALLPGAQLGEFLELAGSLGLAALVEVHTEEELEAALSTPAPIIGINNHRPPASAGPRRADRGQRKRHLHRGRRGLAEGPAGRCHVGGRGVDLCLRSGGQGARVAGRWTPGRKTDPLRIETLCCHGRC